MEFSDHSSIANLSYTATEVVGLVEVYDEIFWLKIRNSFLSLKLENATENITKETLSHFSKASLPEGEEGK